MKRGKLGQRGFTLVEIIFVLAIILTLVAIFLPLATNKLSQANETRAQADEDALSAALTAFFSDLGIWPANIGNASPTGQTLQYLLVGDGGNVITSTNPTVLGANWDTGATCPPGGTGSVESALVPSTGCNSIQNAFNHLALNNPNADATENSTNDYKSTGKRKKWNGPYIAKLAADPFGNNYVINVGAVTGTGGGTLSTEKGWILSAGPNGSLNTAATDSATSSDDIGYIYCTKCQ